MVLTTHFRSPPSGRRGTQEEPLIFRVSLLQNMNVTLVCLFLVRKKILIHRQSEQAEMTSGESCCSQGHLRPIVQYSQSVHVRHCIALA